jgi:hypothetical protein
MEVLSSPEKFGKTVGAARGSMKAPYDKKVNFAKLLDISVPKLTRMEEGAIGTIGATTEERRHLAERIVEKSGALPEWFGLSEPEPGAVDQLRKDFEQKLVEQKNELRAEAATERELLEARLSLLESAVPKPK